MDAITRGFSKAMDDNPNYRVFALAALNRINTEGKNPSMVVGDPKAQVERVEDDGRTLILPLGGSEKAYACLNEAEGVTLMLAEEY